MPCLPAASLFVLSRLTRAHSRIYLRVEHAPRQSLAIFLRLLTRQASRCAPSQRGMFREFAYPHSGAAIFALCLRPLSLS